MPKTFKQQFLREKETRQLFKEFKTRYGVDAQTLLKDEAIVQEITDGDLVLYAVNKRPILARQNSILHPTLLFEEILTKLPKIVVDMGAVAHICNGADLMAPGIVRVEGDFAANALVLVVDEKYGKPLAFGLALTDSLTLSATERGKTAKNIHYVGDHIWDRIKEIKR